MLDSVWKYEGVKKKKEDGVSHMSHGAAVSRDGSTNHEELNLTDRVVNV